jgi:hypothetical protein
MPVRSMYMALVDIQMPQPYMGRLRYAVVQKAPRLFVIWDIIDNTPFKGRFHTEAQANEWIDLQVKDFVLYLLWPDSDYGSRARAHLLRNHDYYGNNEQHIRDISA